MPRGSGPKCSPDYQFKEIINSGGEKISPFEIDEALMEHQGVSQAIAFAIPHDKLGEAVGAAVVLREQSQHSPEELRAFAAERLAKFKVPRKIVVVSKLPLGPTGKPQRIDMARILGLL